MSATVREARMIEQPGREKRGLMQEDAGGRQRFRRQSPSSVASDRREQETRVFPMIMFFEIEAARPLRVEDGRAVCADIRGGVERGAFLVPFGHSQRSLFCAAAQGLGHRREASARWAVARSAKRPKVGSETSGGRGQRPPRRLSDRESAPNPGRRAGKRVPCGHLGRRPKATRSAPEGSVSPVGCCAQRKATRRREQIQGLRADSAQNADICEGSETMSATVREARMIEQPGRPLHPIHSPCLPSLSQYSGRTCSNLSPYLSGSPPANVSRRA